MVFKSSSLFAVAIIAVTLTFAQQPSPTCYTPNGGTSGAGNCSRFINTFCGSTANSAVAADAIAARDRTSRCFNLVDGLGRRCEFAISNTLTTDLGTIPTNANCMTGLLNVANHCDFGGNSAVTGDTTFLYNLDIKNGGCNTVILSH